MKLLCSVLGSAVCLLVLVASLPAQSLLQSGEPVPVPVSVNLDIPPDTPPDPEQVQAEVLATEAVEQPQAFHEALLASHPERGAAEELGALAILFPDLFARAHAKSPDEVRAEVIAAQAILNPHFPLTIGPN